jgi:hypothetical protein
MVTIGLRTSFPKNTSNETVNCSSIAASRESPIHFMFGQWSRRNQFPSSSSSALKGILMLIGLQANKYGSLQHTYHEGHLLMTITGNRVGGLCYKNKNEENAVRANSTNPDVAENVPV